MQHFPDIDPAVAKPWLAMPADWRRPGVSEKFTVLWDADRSYGQLWPRPTPDEITASYQLDAYYTHTNIADANGAKLAFGQRLQTRLAWLADRGTPPDIEWWAQVFGPAPLRILEIGCGNGTHLTKLAKLGHTVRGVEPDPGALEVARSAGHIVHPGTAEALPDAVLSDHFDAVIVMHVLEHCIDPARAIGNATRLLDKGGIVIVEVPNNECYGGVFFGPLWHWFDVPRHLNFFTTKSLTSFFNDAGLQIDAPIYNGYSRQFSPGWKYFQTLIAAAFGRVGDRRITTAGYWRYLRQSIFMPARRKYDSVRLVGRVAEQRQ